METPRRGPSEATPTENRKSICLRACEMICADAAWAVVGADDESEPLEQRGLGRTDGSGMRAGRSAGRRSRCGRRIGKEAREPHRRVDQRAAAIQLRRVRRGERWGFRRPPEHPAGHSDLDLGRLEPDHSDHRAARRSAGLFVQCHERVGLGRCPGQPVLLAQGADRKRLDLGCGPGRALAYGVGRGAGRREMGSWSNSRGAETDGTVDGRRACQPHLVRCRRRRPGRRQRDFSSAIRRLHHEDEDNAQLYDRIHV